jgi:hypothetical protein
MVDGFHVCIQNRMMKPVAIVLSETGRGLCGWWGEDGGVI